MVLTINQININNRHHLKTNKTHKGLIKTNTQTNNVTTNSKQQGWHK